MEDLSDCSPNVNGDVSSVLNGKPKMNGVEAKTPFLIGVAGGTASGKSTVCKRIMEKLGQADMDHAKRQVVTISQDCFYRVLTPAEKEKADKGLFNFDHPDAFDDVLILKTLKDILAGKKCEIPVYDYIMNSRVENKFTTIYPADVVLFEGILVFYFPEIRDLFHMKLFVDTDSDTRLARRVPRDIKERGRDLEQVLHQYMNFVKPAFEDFCMPNISLLEPEEGDLAADVRKWALKYEGVFSQDLPYREVVWTKKFADIILPRGADNAVAIDLIMLRINSILQSGGTSFSSPGHLCHTTIRHYRSGSGSLSR